MFLFRSEKNANPDARLIFRRLHAENAVKIDRVFAKFLLAQWAAGLVVAFFVSPTAWASEVYSRSFLTWLAFLIGGAISAVPVVLCWFRPGEWATRQSVAVAQSLFSCLIIFLTAGRIESHFHVFVSLAMLVAYRDRTVFIPLIGIVVFDNVIRGYFWPKSIYGTEVFYPLQLLEHLTWIGIETFGLSCIVNEKLRQLLDISSLRADIEAERRLLESRVQERTHELAEAEAFKDTVLDSIDALVCILDSDCKVVFVNDRWSRFGVLNGVGPAGPIGVSYLEVCRAATVKSQETVQRIGQAVQAVVAGEMEDFSTEYECGHGETKRCFQLRLSPVRYAGVRGAAVVHVDITQMKLAERRAASLARLILDSPDEVLVAEAESLRFVEVNHGACVNSGYGRDELLRLSLLDIFVDCSKADFHALTLSPATASRSVYSLETSARRRDGTQYPCRVNLHRGLHEDRDVWVAFVTDLTEQQKLQDRLQHAQKLESIGNLAAGVAHEINTPMQCVVGNVEFLQKSFDQLTALSDRLVDLLETSNVDWSQERNELQKLRESLRYDFLREQTPNALSEAVEGAKRVISVVRAMKVMSHPGSASAVETDLHELIQNASIVTRTHWKESARMEFSFAADIPKIEAFPAELSQMLINMFVNAADAIAERLGPTPDPLGEIRVETYYDSESVYIAIRDNGNGIPEKIRKQIFDPFFTTKQVGKGTGQGLSIAYDVVVNKHGGSIEVSSRVGIGTTFTVELPIRRKTTSVPAPLPLSTAVPKSVVGQAASSSMVTL